MSRASDNFLANLHSMIAEEFARQLKEGTRVPTKDGFVETISPTPALLNAARQFLKDNHIEATGGDEDSALNRLAKSMGSFSHEDDEDHADVR